MATGENILQKIKVVVITWKYHKCQLLDLSLVQLPTIHCALCMLFELLNWCLVTYCVWNFAYE